MDINNHPCFNAEARHHTGRIHLPVAPKCNVQCNFCDRKFDCANESRPGVATEVLKPLQAIDYLEKIDRKVPNLAVVGIAGPGDPFANINETLETLELVHNQYPDKLLCISSNGLALLEYIPFLAEINVSHVTITVNAVDPVIGAEIYEWVHFDKKTYFGVEGATILLQRQTEAIKALKNHGITVKINTVVIPRVNEHHIHEISAYVAKLGADVQNCIPLIPVEGTPFGKLTEPTPSIMRGVRAKTSVHIKQMSHCARCRADAVGLLGESNNAESNKLLFDAKRNDLFNERPYIAVTSIDGITVNQHLGEASHFLIFGKKDGKVELIEQRSLNTSHLNGNRWDVIASTISDCAVLLVNGIGPRPLEVLSGKGLYVEAVRGPVDICIDALFSGKAIPSSSLKLAGNCGVGAECSGQGQSCS
jgi:nitrogen fixation protein NifB